MDLNIQQTQDMIIDIQNRINNSKNDRIIKATQAVFPQILYHIDEIAPQFDRIMKDAKEHLSGILQRLNTFTLVAENLQHPNAFSVFNKANRLQHQDKFIYLLNGLPKSIKDLAGSSITMSMLQQRNVIEMYSHQIMGVHLCFKWFDKNGNECQDSLYTDLIMNQLDQSKICLYTLSSQYILNKIPALKQIIDQSDLKEIIGLSINHEKKELRVRCKNEQVGFGIEQLQNNVSKIGLQSGMRIDCCRNYSIKVVHQRITKPALPDLGMLTSDAIVDNFKPTLVNYDNMLALKGEYPGKSELVEVYGGQFRMSDKLDMPECCRLVVDLAQEYYVYQEGDNVNEFYPDIKWDNNVSIVANDLHFVFVIQNRVKVCFSADLGSVWSRQQWIEI